jgi:hypothetical protein
VLSFESVGAMFFPPDLQILNRDFATLEDYRYVMNYEHLDSSTGEGFGQVL